MTDRTKTGDDAMVERLDTALDLIAEAKGSEGPTGGFVTDHLDAAENWIMQVRGFLDASHHAELVQALAYWMSREDLLPDCTIDDVVFRTKSRELLTKIGGNQ